MTTEKTPKVKKPQGPIRWNAVIPFAIICALVFAYFHFFFDLHLRKTLEWGGYKAVGAEVNIGKLDTSFFKASLRIQNIEITDAEKPAQNMLEIGDIRWGMSWDALLRAKILVNEAIIENIQFATTRKHPGKVAPPEPPPKPGPGAVEQEATRLKEEALAKAQEEYANNMLGDLAAILGGSDANAQLGKIEGSLNSKKRAQELEAEIKGKQKLWDEKMKALPQGKDIQALNDRLNKVKIKDFKTPQELQASVKEIEDISKQGDAYYKQIGSTASELEKDLKKMEADIRELDGLVKADIKALETRFRIPSINTKDLTRALFNKYLGKYIAKINHYRAMAEKYLPPKYAAKISGKPAQQEVEEEEIPIQPHPREVGVTYEFGRKNSYPLLWIKKAAISSQAGMSPKAGNIRGEILDITTHQALTGRPTVASLAGDFPADQIKDVLLKLVLDNTQADSLITYKMAVGSYPINGTDLVNSSDVKIALKSATGKLDIDGELKALRDFKMNLNNQFTTANFDISAKDGNVDSILKNTFAGLPAINLTGSASGHLPSISFDVASNMGSELEKGLRKQVEAKIAEARKQIEEYINKEIGKNREQIDKQIKQMRGQFDGEVKKAQGQLDAQKKQAEAKINQAKKDAENQGKKEAEKQGKKAADALKKKFGL
ncbi:TIGR03545 family protein [Bdellovibrio sp. HCB337]|uniref:TIGR03545 family protein n=1 Tax=Bdellovibrio sp. HCB337 TaxID=3394358 RepID=UPI0039A51243